MKEKSKSLEKIVARSVEEEDKVALSFFFSDSQIVNRRKCTNITEITRVAKKKRIIRRELKS